MKIRNSQVCLKTLDLIHSCGQRSVIVVDRAVFVVFKHRVDDAAVGVDLYKAIVWETLKYYCHTLPQYLKPILHGLT